MRPTEIAVRRLIAQALAPSVARPSTPTTLDQAARYMVVTQGQNYAGGLTALAVRAGQPEEPLDTNTSHLDTVLTDYAIIRIWTQRGTLHYTTPADYWVTTYLGPRSITGKLERHAAGFGVTLDEYEAARHLVLDATAHPTSRDALRALFAEQGYPRELLGHHLRRAGSAGTIIQIRRTGQHDTFVHAKTAIPEAVELAQQRTADQNTKELVARYFATRGPATVDDFCWWSSLPKTGAIHAAQALVSAGELTSFEQGTATYYMGTWQQDVAAEELTAACDLELHLPAFDEFFIAYKDRSHLFAQGIDPLTIMTKNGISWPFYVRGGLIAGRAI